MIVPQYGSSKIAFDWNDLPVGREFDCKFWKKAKSPPHALPPPPPPPTGITLIGTMVCTEVLALQDLPCLLVYLGLLDCLGLLHLLGVLEVRGVFVRLRLLQCLGLL